MRFVAAVLLAWYLALSVTPQPVPSGLGNVRPIDTEYDCRYRSSTHIIFGGKFRLADITHRVPTSNFNNLVFREFGV